MPARLIGKVFVNGELVETQELMATIDEAGLASIREQAQRAAALTDKGLDAGQDARLEVWDPDGDIGPADRPIVTVYLSP